MVKGRLATIILVVAGCSRYEYVNPDCGSSVIRPAHSRIEWQYQGARGSLTGQVVDLSTRAPVPDAQWRISGQPFHVVDSLGRIHATYAQTGADTLFVRAINHGMAVGRIDLRPDSGLTFIALMEAQIGAATDGCGYVLVPRRKPWWKPW